MTSPQLHPAEALRTPDSVVEPDPRTRVEAGHFSLSLAAHHAHIAQLQLSSAIPEPVAIQFETAKNLYLYAWHVYRFYMVSASQALTTLELGLRQRLPPQLPKSYQPAQKKPPMLSGMLKYAIDQGFVRNEGFKRWHEAAAHQARERRSMAYIQEMIDKKLESMEIDQDEPLVITPDDQRWDLVKGLSENLPTFRNTLAHGSSMLTDNVFGTLELVAEILEQLYSSPSPRP
jgi:hypothetical protein